MTVRRTLLVLPAVAALALAGCSSSDSSSSPSAKPSVDRATASAAAQDMTLNLSSTSASGPVVIRTDPKAALATASMSALTQSGYFDGTKCHRLVTQGIYVLQCGDPTATGTGGPGYAFADENLPVAGPDDYPAGTVAMANSGPGTNGSQFFIVYDNTTLGPDYTIWGTVTSGLDTVKQIAAQGNAPDGVGPKNPVTITTATIKPAG